MTNEEAIKMLKQWNEDLLPYEDEKEGIECHNIAISALEKQIPKKPILDTIFPSGVKWWRCPVCNKIIVGCIANRPQKYCANCGQALDFNSNGSDTE